MKVNIFPNVRSQSQAFPNTNSKFPRHTNECLIPNWLRAKELKFRRIFLINDIKENGINGDTAIHVDLESMIPPQNLGGAANINSSVEQHLALSDIRNKVGCVLCELESVESSGESEELAGPGWLRTGLNRSRAEEGALVEDGHVGGGVVDWGDVGVGDVDGEEELGVEEWEVELEGSEVDGDEMEGRVLWFC